MNMTQIRQKAAGLGIAAGKVKKADLIHTIQKTEGNTACYGRAQGHCDQAGCCFRDDCLRIKT